MIRCKGRIFKTRNLPIERCWNRDAAPYRIGRFYGNPMGNAIRAGFLYFVAVFGIGFLLGTIRVLVLIPRLGELVSTVIELPIILGAAWLVSAWLTARFHVPSTWHVRLTMGGIAFGLLMVAELALSVWLFDSTAQEHFAAYLSLPQAIGLAGQVAFALIPLIQRGKRNQVVQD